MAEASQYTIPYKELATVMIKHLDIHEGFWHVFFTFGIQGVNLSVNNAPYVPTAMVPILNVGISREAELTPLAVDASVVNPVKPRRREGERRATKRAKK